MTVPPAADLPTALVLTAGLGTRLEPLTYIRAKAAVPVNGDALARRIISWLVAEGVRDLVLNLHHLPASITASVGDGSDLRARVRYSWENPVLGSAGGPRHALPLLIDRREKRSSRSDKRETRSEKRSPRSEKRETRSEQPFLIVNGDTLTNVSIADMLSVHASSGAAITMALIPNPRPEKYGGVLVSNEGWVSGFSRAGADLNSYHFVGIQLAHARVFESLQDGVPSETVNGVYRQLIKEEPRSIGAFVCDASFRDIGTPADYLDTSIHLSETEGNHLANGTRVKIHPSASVSRTAIWDDVEIGANAVLLDCIVCDGAVVPPGAHYQRCAILPGADRVPRGQQRIDGGLLISPF